MAVIGSMIVAQAFRYMQLAPPSSFEDDSDKARDAEQMYPVAVRAVLEAGDWSFASRTVQLSELVSLPDLTAEDDDLPWAYKVPGDFVAMRQVEDGEIRWRIDENGLLRADEPGPLKIRYTRYIENLDNRPANFRMAVAGRLACYLAPVHVEASTTIERLEQLAAQLEKQALRADAGSASAQRYDGRDVGGMWADEVTR
ncbi:hypothetical protein D2T31_00615 [Sinirhodobacter populi]|uniref:Uncharacterized protein n=1 Tax=Paenirhodobacter populi TaxID=2306993 RepID=A0A443KIF0_9RHOB|nr:hypothetical protein [Sinirhodobacter populi]RWR32520.1 hypothetical protein D2T31_00615 [Sinirhodobacter populi]